MLFAQGCERTFEGSPLKGSRSKGSNLVLCNNAELANPCKAGRSQGGDGRAVVVGVVRVNDEKYFHGINSYNFSLVSTKMDG